MTRVRPRGVPSLTAPESEGQVQAQASAASIEKKEKRRRAGEAGACVGRGYLRGGGWWG